MLFRAIEAALKKAKVVESRILPMTQGQKQSRIVAWTFCANGEREKWRRERWAKAEAIAAENGEGQPDEN